MEPRLALAGMLLITFGLVAEQSAASEPRLVLRFRVPGVDGFARAESSGQAIAPDTSGAFITVWDTTRDGIVNDRTITLPLLDHGEHDLLVDWGSSGPGTGPVTAITNDPDGINNLAAATYTYATPGTYEISITSPTGRMGGWSFAATSDRRKLTRIKGWGPFRFGARPETSRGEFTGAVNMQMDPAIPDVPTIGATLYQAFQAATSLTGIPNAEYWDTGNVTNMRYVFFHAYAFNDDISSWDVSAVSDFGYAFAEAWLFNQDLSAWNIGNAGYMRDMFANAFMFDGDLSGWNTANVTTMQGMFIGTPFNRDISMWDTQNVANMAHMFWNASAFNRDLSGWCVPLIPVPPPSFDASATGWTLPDSRPVWGSCP